AETRPQAPWPTLAWGCQESQSPASPSARHRKRPVRRTSHSQGELARGASLAISWTWGSPGATGVPAAGAELAAVDDAVVLVAGGAERDAASHPAIADRAVEKIGNRAALVALIEREADYIAAQASANWPLEQGRLLLAAELRAALL